MAEIEKSARDPSLTWEGSLRFTLEREGLKETLRNLPSVKERLLNANLGWRKPNFLHFMKELFKEDLLNPPLVLLAVLSHVLGWI